MQKEEKPPWIKPRLKSAPKIRQIYWCEFWRDSRLPEMWKTRPVIVISYKNSLYGPCLVVPTSTVPHEETDKWAYRISAEIEGVRPWALCNQLCTISASRLIQFNKGMYVLPQADFNQILARINKWLPAPFDLEK